MDRYLIDYSNGRLTPQQVVGAVYQPLSGERVRYSGALRYLPKKGSSGVSVLTELEVAEYKAAGIGLGLYGEQPNPGWMLGGHAVGREMAAWWRDIARAIGVVGPREVPRCIYFADDAVHTASGDVAQVMACLDGAAEVIGHGSVGIYGFRAVVAAAHSGGHATWRALTGSQPNSTEVRSLGLHLYQHNYEQPRINGVACDVLTVYQPDWGGHFTMSANGPEHWDTADWTAFQGAFQRAMGARYDESPAMTPREYLAGARKFQGDIGTRLGGITADLGELAGKVAGLTDAVTALHPTAPAAGSFTVSGNLELTADSAPASASAGTSNTSAADKEAPKPDDTTTSKSSTRKGGTR